MFTFAVVSTRVRIDIAGLGVGVGAIVGQGDGVGTGVALGDGSGVGDTDGVGDGAAHGPGTQVIAPSLNQLDGPTVKFIMPSPTVLTSALT